MKKYTAVPSQIKCALDPEYMTIRDVRYKIESPDHESDMRQRHIDIGDYQEAVMRLHDLVDQIYRDTEALCNTDLDIEYVTRHLNDDIEHLENLYGSIGWTIGEGEVL